MVELRILSGLHRGATLPLDGRVLIIGASEEADVVLVDRGIEDRHATLAPDADTDGWTLSTLGGPVLGAEHNTPLAQRTLAEGDFARLGEVWLCLSDDAAPWPETPPEPRQEPYLGPDPTTPDEDAYGPAVTASAPGHDLDNNNNNNNDHNGHNHGHDGGADDELYQDSPLDETPPAAPPKPQPAPSARPQAGLQHGKAAKARRLKLVLMPLMVITFLSACAAYAITGRSASDALEAGNSNLSSSSSSADGLATPAAAAAAVAAAMKLPAAPVAPVTPLSPLALQEAFRQRLREVDLLKRINLDLNPGNWQMQASLDAEEAARFDRILKAFVKTHNIRFPVHARVGGTEVMLPFKVREVVSGAQASIVTQDGQRLYVGDEYRGLRLVAVENGQLLFDGDRKVRVKW